MKDFSEGPHTIMQYFNDNVEHFQPWYRDQVQQYELVVDLLGAGGGK